MHRCDSILLDFTATDKAADKKGLQLGANRELEPPKSITLRNAQMLLKTNEVITSLLRTSLLRLRYYAAFQAPLFHRAGVASSCCIVVTSLHPRGGERADAALATH
jgi:hypothetical protein